MRKLSEMQLITDKIAREWGERHGFDCTPTSTLREAISDARSIQELASHPTAATPASEGWQPIELSQPQRNSWAIYWHKSPEGGFPDIAHEWRDEDHRQFASHWLPYIPPATQPESP